MKRTKLSLMAWALTSMVLLIGGLAQAWAQPAVVYSLSKDPDIQGMAVGKTFESTTWLIRSGDPALTIADKGGVKVIKIVGRDVDWDCIDLRNLASLPDGFKYTVKAMGVANSGDKMKLSQGKGPYKTHVTQDVGATGAFSLEKTFTYAELQDEKAVRIQSEGTFGTFTVEEIIVTSVPAPMMGAADQAAAAGSAMEPISITFSAADKALWGAKFTVPTDTNAAMEWVSDFGNGDKSSLKGSHLASSKDYTGALNAIRLTFDKPLAKNAVYTVTYDVYVPAAGNKGKDTLTGPGFVLNGDYSGASGVVKFPVAFGTIDIGSWMTVSASTPVGGLGDALKSIDFRFVVNEAPKHPEVWYIDNIKISQKMLLGADAEPDYMKYPALKDVYKDYFLVGTAAVNGRMADEKLDLIKFHFNSFTPENEMKPQSVQGVQGEFNFEPLDEQLAKVPGMALIGHTLTWHSQSPTWMWGSPTALNAKKAKANMDAHIAAVMKRYGKRLYSVDVVNEAMADGASDADWKKNLRTNEGWYLAMGPAWVEQAFLSAAKIVDANKWNCKLYYNDYNLDYPAKAKAVYEMVKDINARNAKKRKNGKPLIEGIGMQAHYSEGTRAANVEESIKLFSTLPGVSIAVTELDVTYANTGVLTAAQAKAQSLKYAELFDVYKRNAAGPGNGKKGRIERVTFWGISDGDSWRGGSFPLVFDKNLRAKEAFKAILDPEKRLAAVLPPAGKTYEAYPPLKDVYKDYFTLGIFGSGEIEALIHNYACFAPGNEMKPDMTQAQKGVFTYDAADAKFKALSERNKDMAFYGHTLAWHSQSPTWLWDAKPARFGQPGTFDKAVALANLRNHIDNVLGYYGGRLKGVDVVNEAIGTAKPGDWQGSLAKGDGWYPALEWRWVELAFARAAKVVDSHPDWNCKLIYNDFGLDSPEKARVVYEMVKDINERYAALRPNGKKLIEVIGMQSHYNLATKASDVEASIKLFATLPGVKVHITEMDIGCPPGPALSAETENDQAMKFAELFKVYMKYATGSANKASGPKVIERVSVCGVRDAVSGWRAGEYALLFSSNGLAKQALIAVLDPEDYLANHKYSPKAASAAFKPVDGISVWDTGRGDTWSGANIILGTDASKWPWSAAGEDGKAAFVPEKGATYRISVNYTAMGTAAIRLRWVKDNSNGAYTKADAAVVNSYPYAADKTAVTIPAHFNSGMVNGGTYTLVTEIKLDGSQPADGLIGNIAVRGSGGGNAYSIDWIKVEKIGTGGADKLLVSWPKKD